MDRIDLKFTCRKIKAVRPKLIGGSPATGVEVKVEQADPDEILKYLFEYFGKDELIKFLED